MGLCSAAESVPSLIKKVFRDDGEVVVIRGSVSGFVSASCSIRTLSDVAVERVVSGVGRWRVVACVDGLSNVLPGLVKKAVWYWLKSIWIGKLR